MTSWQDLGYVPDSEGEDSGGELSTQEDVDVPVIWSPAGDNAIRAVTMKMQGTPTMVVDDTGSAERETGDFMGIDAALGSLDEHSASTGAVARVNISEVDLSAAIDDDDIDMEDGGVGLLNGPPTGVPDEPMDPQRAGVIGSTPTRERSESPDPITGEPQPRRRFPLQPAKTASSSATSSPLSSVPPSPETTPPSSLRASASAARQRASGVEVLIPAAQTQDPLVMSPSSPFFQRAFRNRKPIQMHPYLLEDARYKQTMKSRGVRPVRLQPPGDAEKPNSKDDSQDGEFIAPPNLDESQAQQRNPLQGVDPKSPVHAAAVRRAGTEDVDARPRIPHNGTKRRKTTHSYSKKGANAPVNGNDDSWLARDHDGDPWQQSHATIPSIPGVYGFPSSPPQATPHRIFNLPDSSPLSPVAAQRPISSGVQRKVDLLTLLDDPGSDNGSSVTPKAISLSSSQSLSLTPTKTTFRHPTEVDEANGEQGSDNNADSSSSSSSSSAEVPSRVVNRFLRKGTRGVLPASFVQLNISRTEGADRLQVERRSVSKSPERRPGVARARVSHRSAISATDPFTEDGDSQSSEEQVMGIPAPVKPRRRPTSTQPLQVIDLVNDDDQDEDEDIPEDNRLEGEPYYSRSAVGARQRNRPKHMKRVRQQTLEQAGVIARRSRRTQGRGIQPKVKRVGIVDAARHHEKTEHQLPKFARIAARSASRHPNFGRHSPSRKLFALDTAQDTADVREVLRNWREGTLQFLPNPDDDPLDDWAKNRTARLQKQRLKPSKGHRPLSSTPFARSTNSRFRSLPTESGQTPLRSFNSTQPGTTPAQRVLHPTPRTRSRNRRSYQSKLTDYASRVSPSAPTAPLRARVRKVVDWGSFIRSHTSRRLSVSRAEKSVSPGISRPSTPENGSATHNPRNARTRMRRKCTPVRVDTDVVERRQPPSHDIAPPVDVLPQSELNSVTSSTQNSRLTGLSPFGSRYSLNFDIYPLRGGTRFGSETLIGKGLLKLALETAPARITSSHSSASATFFDQTLNWGVYDETVATSFERAVATIGEKMQDLSGSPVCDDPDAEAFALEAYLFYGFVVHYLSFIISFHDPLDMVPLGRSLLSTVEMLCERGAVVFSDSPAEGLLSTRSVLQSNVFALLIALQISRLSSHSVQIQQEINVQTILTKITRQLVSRLVRCGFEPLRNCYESQRRHLNFEGGIGRDHYLAEAWLVSIKTADSGLGEMSFWQLFNQQLRVSAVERGTNVKAFEALWHATFAVLPLRQFDELGIATVPNADISVADNWELVKAVTGRPLRACSTDQYTHRSSTKAYVRILCARSHHLVTVWMWPNADLIIPTLYDFFAGNGLASLPDESHYGSPSFLHNLDKEPSLEVEDSDPSFHIFLKTVAAGLHRISRIDASGKRARSLVYRLMPNHRQQYAKDQGLRSEDLLILRNHHCLLETLYWAAPPNYRPPMDAIRLLVDPESSHTGTCTVAVRAWSDLLRFQLNSGEGPEQLQRLMEWFSYLVTKLLAQHHAARSEGERLFALAKEKDDYTITEAHLEDNIRRNQQRVENVLNDLLKSLRIEMVKIKGQVASAILLLPESATGHILNAFTRVSPNLVIECLSLISDYVQTCRVEGVTASISTSNEDSQDYGDWSDIGNLVLQDEERQAAQHLLSTAYDPLHRLISNCFGADHPPGDTFLIKAVDTWCILAGFLVKHGLKTWSIYLDYSRESWSSLRDTPQTRKYTSYFMPKIIEYGGDVYNTHKINFLRFWAKGLAEFESMLKFQNDFTATVMNRDINNPLFFNTPFIKNDTGKYVISMYDFKARRLALISSVLQRMREIHDATVGPSSTELKHEYSDIVRAMMRAMRDNYEALQAVGPTGAYVAFVHSVVEALQQHITDIVEVDRYFTNSSAFPLPVGDPNYVVGRLKKYTPKLAHIGSQKELNVFIQAQCERAALNNDYSSLVHQITTAISAAETEEGDSEKPTLRSYFLQAIFPAYVETCFQNPIGWIVGIPMLSALEAVARGIFYATDSTYKNSVDSVTVMLEVVLDAFRKAAGYILQTPGAFDYIPNIATITATIQTVAAVLALADWLEWSWDSRAAESLRFLIKFTYYAQSITYEQGIEDAERPLDVLAFEPTLSIFETGKKHCAEMLLNSLDTQWAQSGGEWIFERGAQRSVIVPPSFPGEAEGRTVEAAFTHAVTELSRIAARTHTFEDIVQTTDYEVWRYESRGRPWSDRGENGRGNALKSLGNLFC